MIADEAYTQWKRPDKKPFLEVNSGVSLVEPQGSIPIKEQVERFTLAGARLSAFKRLNWDAVDEKEEITLDDFYPMLPDADPVEIANAWAAVTRRIKEKAKAAAEAKVAEEAERKKAELEAVRAEIRAELEKEVQAQRE